MLESSLTNKIRLRIKADGHYVWKARGDPRQTKGIPDLCGCRQPDGKFFGLEVKVPGREKTLTLNQAENLKRIRDAGGIAGVVTSVREAMEAIREQN